MTAEEYTQHLKSFLLDSGSDLVGVADTKPLNKLKVHPPDLLYGFTRAVSIGIELPLSSFDNIEDRPTSIYGEICKAVNRRLDNLACRVSAKLRDDGYPSLALPASQVIDKTDWHAAISHKAVARMAGVGWQGKSLLLITPQFGPRVRLVTVLTRAPLLADKPIKNRCGSCTLCQEFCPAGAIKGVSTTAHYKDRDEALYFSRCVEKLVEEYQALPEIGQPLCGICIKVCPFGRKMNNF